VDVTENSVVGAAAQCVLQANEAVPSFFDFLSAPGSGIVSVVTNYAN